MKDLISQIWNSISRCSSWCLPLLVGLKCLPKKSAHNSRWVFYLLCCDGAGGYVLPPEACLSSGDGLGWHHWEKAPWWPFLPPQAFVDWNWKTHFPAPGPQFQQLICLRNDDPKSADISPALKVNCRNHPRTDHHFFSGVGACVNVVFIRNEHPSQTVGCCRHSNSTRHAWPWAAGARFAWPKNWGSGFLTAGWSAQVLFLGKPSRSVAKMKGFPNRNV